MDEIATLSVWVSKSMPVSAFWQGTSWFASAARIKRMNVGLGSDDTLSKTDRIVVYKTLPGGRKMVSVDPIVE